MDEYVNKKSAQEYPTCRPLVNIKNAINGIPIMLVPSNAMDNIVILPIMNCVVKYDFGFVSSIKIDK